MITDKFIGGSTDPPKAAKKKNTVISSRLGSKKIRTLCLSRQRIASTLRTSQ